MPGVGRCFGGDSFCFLGAGVVADDTGVGCLRSGVDRCVRNSQMYALSSAARIPSGMSRMTGWEFCGESI